MPQCLVMKIQASEHMIVLGSQQRSLRKFPSLQKYLFQTTHHTLEDLKVSPS